jgi:hypothetical protein
MSIFSSALETVGAALIVYAVWTFSPALAIAMLGLVLIGTGYSLGGKAK